MDQIVNRPRVDTTPPVDPVLDLGPNRTPAGRWLRRLVPLVVLVGAFGAGAWWWGQPAAPKYAYTTAPVERRDLTVEVSATGTLQPLIQVDISSELSGVVRSVAVKDNDLVKKGDKLAELDTVRISANVERARASVEVAEAQVGQAAATLKEAEQALARARQLHQRGMASQQVLDTAQAEFDRAQAAMAVAKANLAIAQADLKLQETDLEKSTIYSPIDGIVLTRDVDPGQTVASSMSAPILFVIAEDLTTMELRAAIDEADIGQVAKDQPARFAVDAFPSRRFDAKISDISYASVTTEGVVTYQARLAVANPELLLRPGMTATVNIVTRQDDNALLVPSAAFRFTPPAPAARRSFSIGDLFNPGRGMRAFGPRGGQTGQAGRAVYVLENGQPVRRQVEIGATSGDMTEVVSGLKEGARVITGIGSGQMRGERPRNAQSSAPMGPPPGAPQP